MIPWPDSFFPDDYLGHDAQQDGSYCASCPVNKKWLYLLDFIDLIDIFAKIPI